MPPYMSNDRFIWTNEEPDAELIEPEILASVDKNWLTFNLQVFSLLTLNDSWQP